MDSIQIEKYKIEIDSLTQEIVQLKGKIEHYNSQTILIIVSVILLIGIIVLALSLVLKRQKELLQIDIINRLEDFKSVISTDKNNRLLVPVSDGHEYLNLDQLIRIEADGRYSVFYFSNKKTLIISINLGGIEKQLDKHQFIRIHNSHIINLKYLDRVTKSDGGFVIMQDNSELPVSKTRRDYLNQVLKN